MKFAQEVYAFVKKKNRANKLSWHAVEAVYVGPDLTVAGAIRAVPFKSAGGGPSIVFGKTLVVRSFKALEGPREYPLLQAKSDAESYEKSKTDTSNWDTVFDSLGFEGAVWDTDWEVAGSASDLSEDEEFIIKEITDHSVDDSDTGVVTEYEVEWEEFPELDDRTWHLAADLVTASGKVKEYHHAHPELIMSSVFDSVPDDLVLVALQAGDLDENLDFDMTEAAPGEDVDFDMSVPDPDCLWSRLCESRLGMSMLTQLAQQCDPGDVPCEVWIDNVTGQNNSVLVVEVPWSDCVKPENIDLGRNAMKREKDTMLEMGLTPLSEQPVSELTQDQIKRMPEFRHSVTGRRPTPAEVALGETAGEWKVRIVSKDLKCKFKKPVESTHSKVPSISDFRLLVAFTDLVNFEVWASDFKCAYLQSFKRMRREWRTVKLYNPDTKEWEYHTCCGVVYGDQEGAAEWKDTLTTGLKSMGFVEIQNAESMYFHSEWGIRTSVHVDDPFMTFDKRKPDYVAIRDNFIKMMSEMFVLKG